MNLHFGKVLNEYLRQHEEALDDMRSDRAVALGSLKTAQRKVSEIQNMIHKIEEEIETIVTDNDVTNDYLAENIGSLGLRVVNKCPSEKRAKLS